MAQKLMKIKGNTYYIDSAVNIGIISNNSNKAIIVDTGLDDEMGRRILRLMGEQGLAPVAIINTHAHADHCGGNNFIVKRTGIPIYAPHFEKAIIEYPLLEPFYLFSASPPKVMKNKFLMAKESTVNHIIKEGKIEIGEVILQVISLAGHSPGMVGIATEDDVLFLGDALFSMNILKKYPLAYFTDIKNTLDTLEFLKSLKYDYFIPSHGDVLDNPIPTIEANINRISEIESIIADLCVKHKSREEITAHMIDYYNIKMNIGQYYLTSSIVSAFLSYMTDGGKLKAEFLDNNLKWISI